MRAARLLLAAMAWGAVPAVPAEPAQQLWSVSVLGEPVAVLFDAASSALYVSSQAEGQARLDRVSLEGKLSPKAVAVADGEAGALVAYDGKFYWAVGPGQVLVVAADGKAEPLKGVSQNALPAALAVDGKGNVYVATSEEEVQRISAGRAEKLLQAVKVRGLFYYVDQLYLNAGGQLLSLSHQGKEQKLGAKKEGELGEDCFGLQRTAAGQWFCAGGEALLSGGKPLLTLQKDRHANPAYVFRMDSAEDFVVVPFRNTRMLRAYRLPSTQKPKKTEK